MMLYRNRLSIFLLAFALVGMAIVASPVAHAATVTVVNNDGAGKGFNDPTPTAPVGGNTGTTLGQQRLIAFQRAADIWGGLLSSPVPIRVGATFDSLPCNASSAVLGAAGPSNAFHDFTGALHPATWYPVALANALNGNDLDPGVDDIGATFNSAFGTTCPFPKGWYYGLDGNAGSDIDFLSVVLHELGHGLGFLTFVNLGSGAKLLGFDDTFMLNLEDHGASPADYPSMSNAQRVAASKDTGNLHWVGAHVRAAGGILTSGRVGDHVRMFAPNPQQQGSSVSHWDTALAPNQLLEPAYTEPLHDPVLELALFQDIGWTPNATGPDLFISSISLTAGNGNGIVDVDECNNLSVTVQNRGTGAATGVSATLAFNAPGLTIAQAGSAYPNIPAGGTGANTTPFKISTAPGFACGSNLDLALTVTTAGGNVFVLPFTLNSGSAAPPTRLDNNTTLQIPDVSTVESAITVSGIATGVKKVTVSFFIDHTSDGDLDIVLVGPDGTTVELTTDNGGAGANYGVACSPDGSRTTFDDTAPTSITAGGAPFTGTFRPEGTLAAFVGKSGSAVNGTWKLRVTDDAADNTGALHCWSLSISGATCADGGGVCQLPPTIQPKLVNISTRGQVGTGDNVMIGGLIVTGSTPKTVLLRGRGPSLSSAPFFVPGTLANPLLRLFSGPTLVAQNDNWQDAPSCAFACGGPSQIIATGLDPCQPNPGQGTPPPNCALESALLVTLPPGAYTAILSGAAGESGVGLVEAFEVDGTTTAANLHNISTRGVVGIGDQIMIGGFVVDGPSPKQVLVRGRGPSLGGAPFGIPGAVADPFLRIFSGATSIARNDNWQDAPDCNAGFTCGAAAQITATGLDPCVPNPGQGTPPPSCVIESAILITLPPGAYTVQLSGAAGQTGVGLVEVFEIPFF